MRSVNKVTLLGYVGADPKIVQTSTGKLIANLSLATSYKKAGKDGTEVTEWHRLTAFDRTAEIVRDYVKKGAALYVEGMLQTRSWDKDGEKRYATEILIRELSMLDKRSGSAGNGGGDETEITDDDIPF